MQYALDETLILGMGTNQAYLRAIAHHPAVREGRVHTGFLGTEFASFAPVPSDEDLALLQLARAQGYGRAGAGGAAAGGGVGGGTAGGGGIASPYAAFGSSYGSATGGAR